MKRISYYIVLCVSILFFAFNSCTQTKNADNSENTAYETEINYTKFKNPTNEYRSFPFYSINDSLTENEIAEQIHGFKQAGFGGFYLHSRLGLITEFLSDDWWTIMGAAVDAANESGLYAMFYDEDKWPSGYAGGIIPDMSEKFRAKCLARLDKNTPFPIGSELIKQDDTYNYIIYTAQYGYDIFNGTCYVDLFDPEVVKQFINVSYRPYAEKYKAKTTDYTFAIFSDEPHIHARYFDKSTPNRGVLSYSPWLEKKFEELYGYSLRDKLNLLFEEKENWREVRMHYYRAKALQFEEAYTKQISGFAAENDFYYTGHYLGEDVLQKVRDRIGNSMLHYRSMQQPGMDHLGLSIANRILTAKSLSSVANQYEKKKRLSELFGISGQNMNFEDRKWIAGWHSILGINHFCPHLTLYSMKGARKRDYPPTFSYQQPYWEYNKKMEDYLGRISYASTVGKYNPQILVINPLESEYIKGNEDGEFTSGINAVLEILQANHYDYDLGDEQILADTAFVEKTELKVGAMYYKHVVLPDMISIRQSTLNLLKELHKNGGIIISTGRFPMFVDGVEDEVQLAEFNKLVITSAPEDFENSLLQNIIPNVLISSENKEKIWSQTRTRQNGKLVQLYNTSHTESIQFELKTEFPDKNVVLWDPSLAKCFKLEPNNSEAYDIEIASSSNLWITSGELSKNAIIEGNYLLPETKHDLFTLNNGWTGKRRSPNALTLDFASYSTNEGKTFSAPEPVIGIFSRLSDRQYYGNLILKYEVRIDDLPSACKLVLEQPKMYKSIKINGKDFTFKSDGFYIDHTFETTEVLSALKEGRNTIQLALDFEPIDAANKDTRKRYGTEIESIYLIGDFGLKAFSDKEKYESYDTQKNRTGDFQRRPVRTFTGFAISKEKTFFTGSLVFEGYPFYAGAFELKQNFTIDKKDADKKYFLELPNCESIVSIVSINGHQTDSLVWTPFTTDITEFLVEGENELQITLVNSLRNLLGPHHHKGGELEKVGPKSFTGAGGFPDGKGESNWYDLRLENKPTAIWTDTYNHIPFGFIEQVKITTN
ncbi:hypothetical protein [uncultured Draconibacterium sp.]|uniref:hypothetical protein n=1 Tax=uncultured Draconibacterium sp. TaxID=1573823 RepID=UPI003216D992